MKKYLLYLIPVVFLVSAKYFGMEQGWAQSIFTGLIIGITVVLHTKKKNK